MIVGRYRFSPPWWGVLVLAVAVPALAALGVWQIQRAHYKEKLVAAQNAARAAGPQPMTPAAVAAAAAGQAGPLRYGRHYVVRGRYDAAHQILLNDQVKGQVTGYRVWTPLVTANGARVLVDRGWVRKPGPAGAPPPSPPAPAGVVRALGYWRGLPQPGLDFGARGNRCGGTHWPKTLNYPAYDKVSCQYAAPVADGLLLLNPDEPGGFVRDWDEDRVGLPPFAHYAYASQWFLAAVVAVIIFAVVNARRRA